MNVIPMTAEQRAEVCARLDELAAEIAGLRREIGHLKPPQGTTAFDPDIAEYVRHLAEETRS